MDKQNTHPLTRRNFLTTTAATVAAFTIVKPSQVRGTQANSKIEMGCIGFGGRGKMIADFFDQHGGYKIKALCDYFPHIAEGALKRYNLSTKQIFSGLDGYKRLIASGVDAVALETPPYCFPNHVTAAVNNGCHVYLAKPVAVDVPGTLRVQKMAKLAAKKSQVFLVDFQMRVNPFLIECIKRVRDGVIGNIKFLRSIYDSDGFSDPPLTKTIESRLQKLIWVNDVELGGGNIVNADIHAIDAALWIAGDIAPVSAQGSSSIMRPDPHGNSKDICSVTYNFKNGLIMNHTGEHVKNLNMNLAYADAYGEIGYMEAKYKGKNWIRSRKGGYKGGEKNDLYPWGAKQNIDTFHKSITQGKYDNPTVAPSINSNLASILGREAAAKNTTVTFNELLKENRAYQPDLTGLTF